MKGVEAMLFVIFKENKIHYVTEEIRKNHAANSLRKQREAGVYDGFQLKSEKYLTENSITTC